jgi:hypothetical protein
VEQGTQVERLQAVLEGHAGNPWQYRVLAPYLVNLLDKLFAHLHIPHHIVVTFLSFRVAQDTLILLLLYVYNRNLKLSPLPAVVGMVLLAWGMSHSYYDSDLQFNTFFDIIFYLLAGICILQGRFASIVPITLLAAFNRETCGFIPVLLMAVSIFALPKGSWRKVMPFFIAASVGYVAIFVGLRLFYGSQTYLSPHGHYPGFDMLMYNLLRLVTWENLIATFSIIPIIAMFGFRRWPVQLRIFFWVIVPAWFLIHAFGAVMAESRLLLVPQAMVFIPGALIFLFQDEHVFGRPVRESVLNRH